MKKLFLLFPFSFFLFPSFAQCTPPIPDFEFTNVCIGNEMNFTNRTGIASGFITSYAWSFGDGAASANTHPAHTYLVAGKYNVTLTAVSDQNCTESITKQVEVYANPVADFSANEVCISDSTAFKDLSTSLSGELISWQWTFGDLETANIEHPKHLYAASGSYNVNLSVRTDKNCRHSVSKTITVNGKPIAEFSVDTACLGMQSSFVNNSSSESGYINRNQWSFGDGTFTQQSYPVKTYTQAGMYLVRLIVETDKQCKDTIEHYAKVRPLPVADFTANEVCNGGITVFRNLSIATDDSIQNHQWNFGDGAFSTEENPKKQYLNPQTYNVSLHVQTLFGCEHQTIKQVVVHKNPVANFFTDNVCLGERIQVVNSSFINTNESLLYEWNLGDGTQNQLKDFTHLYANPGDYKIILKVQSSKGGCTDSIERTINIYPLPNISAGEDATTGRGMPVELHAQGGRYYNWFPAEFLNNSLLSNPVATISQNQIFVVIGEDIYGCLNSDSVTVFVTDDNKVFPANFITPDGNGQNDTWVIGNIENYPDAKVMIFDLNGQLIYSTTNYQNNWDGRNKNGDILPDGTYYYVISFNNDERVYKGALAVMRKE